MNDMKFLTAFFVSLGALVFSFLSYRRSRRFENENHIFKLKVDVYSRVIAEMTKLLNELQENIDIAREYLAHQTDTHFNNLNDQADEIDELCFQFNDFVVNNSLVIPLEILDQLQKFCSKVMNGDTVDADGADIVKEIQLADKLLDSLIKDAESISSMLRKDLHIEELNTALYRRLRR